MTEDRQRRSRWRWAAVGLLVTLVAVIAWGLIEARRVSDELTAADAAQREVRAGLAAGDTTEVADAVARLERSTRAASAAAESPPLRLASWLPLVGDDVSAVQVVSNQLSRFATDVLRPMAATSERLRPETLVVAGRIDVTAMAAERESVRAAADSAALVADEVGTVPTDGLVERLRTQVESAQRSLDDVAVTLATTAAAVEVVPAMLGAEGPRTYVVAVQNLAEARPTGGIFGAWAHLEAQDGQLRLLATGADNEISALDVPPESVAPEAAALYGPDLALVPNINLTPDFPQAARLLSAAWEGQGRPAPDGVLAVDPVFLQVLLEATGPVQVAGGQTVEAAGAVDLLMHDVYVDIGGDSDERRNYLGDVTEAVFQAVTTDPGALSESVAAMREPDVRKHVLIWSRHDPEQELLQRTSVTGALPEPDDGTIGVYVTNADGSKLDYWLSGSVTTGRCGGTGMHAVVNLTNGAPAQVPTYMGNQLGVTGAALKNLTPGSTSDRTTHRVVVSLLLPPGRGLAGLRVDEVPAGFAAGVERGWSVLRASVDLPAGQTVQLDWSLSGPQTPPDTVLTQALLHPFDIALYAEVDACRRT